MHDKTDMATLLMLLRRKHVCTILWVTALVIMGCKQDNSRSEHPQISLAHNKFLGECLDSESMLFRIPVENKGKGRLVIDKIKSTCGCTIATDFKKVINPGEVADVEITMGYRGSSSFVKHANLGIISNDPCSFYPVFLKGIFKKSYELQPKEIHFGDIMYGKGSRDIKYRLITTQKPVNEVQVTSSNECVVITERGKPKKEVYKGIDRYVLEGKARLLDSHPIGTIEGYLEVDFVEQGQYHKKARLPLGGAVLDVIQMTPNCLVIMHGGSSSVEIKHAQGKNIQAQDIMVPQGITVENSSISDQQTLLTVVADKDVKEIVKTIDSIKVSFRVGEDILKREIPVSIIY